jgi:hypothetical protein
MIKKSKYGKAIAENGKTSLVPVAEAISTMMDCGFLEDRYGQARNLEIRNGKKPTSSTRMQPLV